jgi:hypothetical protein
MSEMQKIHLSNDVVHLIPEKRELHSMYEDSDLDGLSEAEEFSTWLEANAPSAFVLVDTGDYITPECSKNRDEAYRKHWYACELYDANYHLYLVPAGVWRDCAEEVEAADAEWRRAKNQCQLEYKPEPEEPKIYKTWEEAQEAMDRGETVRVEMDASEINLGLVQFAQDIQDREQLARWEQQNG